MKRLDMVLLNSPVIVYGHVKYIEIGEFMLKTFDEL